MGELHKTEAPHPTSTWVGGGENSQVTDGKMMIQLEYGDPLGILGDKIYLKMIWRFEHEHWRNMGGSFKILNGQMRLKYVEIMIICFFGISWGRSV